MGIAKPKTEFERRMEILRKRASSKAKLRRTFATVLSKLEALAARHEGSKQKNLLLAKAAVEKIATRVEADGKPTINVSEFLDLRSPDYASVVNTLHDLEAKTLLQFCSIPLAQIKVKFRECGIDFPVHLEMVHVEYRREG